MDGFAEGEEMSEEFVVGVIFIMIMIGLVFVVIWDVLEHKKYMER